MKSTALYLLLHPFVQGRHAISSQISSKFWIPQMGRLFYQQGTVVNHAHIFRIFCYLRNGIEWWWVPFWTQLWVSTKDQQFSGGPWRQQRNGRCLKLVGLLLVKIHNLYKSLECVYLCMWVLTKDSHTYILYHMLIELVENCWWHRWVNPWIKRMVCR